MTGTVVRAIGLSSGREGTHADAPRLDDGKMSGPIVSFANTRGEHSSNIGR
jgi:hypothetical protein